ncbi:4-diphosphocytidyl-2-C-methyl-D-erythritol kinase [Rubrobacter xylanophilus]|uniref:4-diphosphocytidyl-2-C-methyl-D-erythritol kinase n=1 Tax=Rubrobacter xylanophilus TaxID=49319 RepID=A0A510HGE8_9ACTN|nr:4-(cytidine 5'-diphospho)-2-C-methyl-D-erythritol kinase [Rubrobacter xylanophilus]BBL78315.1 4-diphosphocytidyl-2-C-methyl-D-erythritol kinase [Rubrobacter xylanophilus]
MSGSLRMRAFAKVNYALEVLGIREDGYHEIRTVLQSISLSDVVEISGPAESFDLSVEPEGAAGPTRENTVFRAWRLLAEETGAPPVRVTLRKGIPAGSGLGGGSADAAALLRGANELFGLGLGEGELAALALRVGADVPFCLSGGTALGEGVGERLFSLPPPPEHLLVVAMPPRGASTVEIYRAYDGALGVSAPGGWTERVVRALGSGDVGALGEAVGNDLAPVTARLVPGVGELLGALRRAGAWGVCMSGTGSAVYGLFREERAAREAARRLEGSVWVRICRPVGYGLASA